ncbi:hypothetical protein C2E23DRAFT_829886 [Lenzites betulinus]|nr:hypothetical protein C2E23DRAFT_829886 [Lenzites betulinus]
MALFGLSHELLVHILSYLDYEHLQLCRLLNRAMDRLIQSSIVLQYSMQLQLYGYEDNPSCPLVLADKMRLLREQETAWSRLDFEKETTIRIPFNPSSIYDLTDGILLLGESVSGIQSGADTVRWTRLSQLIESEDLPSSQLWEKIDVGAHIIDVGLSVEEHDLIVVATDREMEDKETKFELRLLQLSTGLNHPLALKPSIPLAVIQEPPQAVASQCSVCIEIVGDLLGFLFHYPAGYTRPPAMFEVYNWKTGQCLEIRGLECPCYSTFTFLSPDVIALPNCAENTIELCRIESTSIDAPPRQLRTSCVLQLPRLGRGYTIAQVTCRSEPKMRNTTGSARAFRSPEPFHLKPADSVVIFNVMTHDSQGFHECLTLIVHTAALLQIFDAEIAGMALLHYTDIPASSFCLPSVPKVEADIIASPTPAIADLPERPPGDYPRISWAQWGPNVCRWLEASFGASRWITTTCGQRYATVEEDPIDDDLTRSTIVVYDFNPRNVHRLAARHRRRRRRLPTGFRDVDLIGPASEFQPMFYFPPFTGGDVLPGPGVAAAAGFALAAQLAPGADAGVGAGVDMGPGVAVGPGEVAPETRATISEYASLIPFTDPETRVIGQIQCEATELMAGYSPQYRIFDETVRTALPYAQLSSFNTYAYGAVLLDKSMVIGVKLNDADDIRELVVHAVKRGK